MQALAAFTQVAANDRVLQQQFDDLLYVLRTQQHEKTVLQNLIFGGPMVNRTSTAVGDSIPKFEGRIDEDFKGFLDHINREAISEGWTDAHRLQEI
jgi:hypothetical protein